MPVQTRGAILRSAPGQWEVTDLVVDDPQAGELQVKLAASGLCHSDDHVATGDMPVGKYPFLGGLRSAADVEVELVVAMVRWQRELDGLVMRVEQQQERVVDVLLAGVPDARSVSD